MATTMRNTRRNSRSNHHIGELRARAVDIGESVRAMATTAGAAAGDSLGPVEAYIRQKPLKSMLLAAGAGAVLGLLFLRR